MSGRALIFGIGGQDGSYLADVLLERGYDVHGTHRRSSVDNLVHVAHCRGDLALHPCDLADHGSVDRVLRTVRPAYVFNEADQDHVGWSHDTPAYSVAVTAGGPAGILESVRRADYPVRVFQPLSSTMFGCPPHGPQDEHSGFDPRSPYACAKVHAYHLCNHYRRTHGVHVSTGIMYTHDSPRRGGDYLLQTICRQARLVRDGVQAEIVLGDPDAEVDVGFAGDYMDAAERILALDEPGNFIISTGDTDRVRNLAVYAMRVLGVKDADDRVLRDPDYPKSLNQGTLVGDYSKLKKATGWSPSVDTKTLIRSILGVP